MDTIFSKRCDEVIYEIQRVASEKQDIYYVGNNPSLLDKLRNHPKVKQANTKTTQKETQWI